MTTILRIAILHRNHNAKRQNEKSNLKINNHFRRSKHYDFM